MPLRPFFMCISFFQCFIAFLMFSSFFCLFVYVLRLFSARACQCLGKIYILCPQGIYYFQAFINVAFCSISFFDVITYVHVFVSVSVSWCCGVMCSSTAFLVSIFLMGILEKADLGPGPDPREKPDPFLLAEKTDFGPLRKPDP